MNPLSDFNSLNLSATADIHAAQLAELKTRSARGLGRGINRRKWLLTFGVSASLLIAFALLSILF